MTCLDIHSVSTTTALQDKKNRHQTDAKPSFWGVADQAQLRVARDPAGLSGSTARGQQVPPRLLPAADRPAPEPVLPDNRDNHVPGQLSREPVQLFKPVREREALSTSRGGRGQGRGRYL